MPPTGTALRLAIPAAALLLALGVSGPARAQSQADVSLDPALLAAYQWRNLGPDRGGRSIAATGVQGPAGRGLLRRRGRRAVEDHGRRRDLGAGDRRPDHQRLGGRGGGERDRTRTSSSSARVSRPSAATSCPATASTAASDAGKTWTARRLRRRGRHLQDPHPPHQPRHRLRGGLRPVQRAQPGARRLQEHGRRRHLAAGALPRRQHRRHRHLHRPQQPRTSCTRRSGRRTARNTRCPAAAPGSGLFKSTDGGETWKEITRNPGLPAEGLVGRIGVAVSRANSNRVYALVENDDGGLFKSDDGGATLGADQRRAAPSASGPSTTPTSSPTRRTQDVVYMENTSLFRSKDGGQDPARRSAARTATSTTCGSIPTTHAPGGGQRRRRRGLEEHRRRVDRRGLPHRAVLPRRSPRRTSPTTCAARSRTTARCACPYDWNLEGRAALRRWWRRSRAGADITAGGMAVAYRWAAASRATSRRTPSTSELFYSGTNNGGYVDKYNRRLGTSREVNPYPWFYSGEPSKDDPRALAVDVPHHLLAGGPQDAVRVVAAAVGQPGRRQDVEGALR